MEELVFNVTPDEFDGGFVAVAVGESIVTQGDTWDELRDMVMDATKLYFEDSVAPQRIRLHLHLEQVLATA
ncbi:type II toxin-antitoxin system HicB family antitoxin [Terriglobus sp. RCC_193]|uniref:type II toxin-antitoxin system HicB family antitoxin n=1 Tax=Terriglobus sp. RCC_193 TaxID=3239218 RepID=UPI0035235A83